MAKTKARPVNYKGWAWRVDRPQAGSRYAASLWPTRPSWSAKYLGPGRWVRVRFVEAT